MAKLPKSIIKKYGISKKAWQVFRGQKKEKAYITIPKYRGQKSRFDKTKVYKMAKKRKFFGKGKKGNLFSKALNIVIGAGVAALYEVFISPRLTFIPKNIKNIVEMILGVILAVMPRLPMAVRAGGAALATINAFEIIVPLVSGMNQKAQSVSMNIDY